jgi:hypothetical protein
MFQYLTTDFKVLCEVMENLVGVRDKEDIASTLVHIMQKLDKAKEFLTEVIIGEVLKQGMQRENISVISVKTGTSLKQSVLFQKRKKKI